MTGPAKDSDSCTTSSNAPSVRHEDALGHLVVHTVSLTPDAPALEAYEPFSAVSSLYAIAVVDTEQRPVGLLNRFKFLETLSRPFGRDLVKHRPVASAIDGAPLVVDERVSLDQLSNLLVDDGTKYIFDGFIVTRQGRYLGI